MNKDPQIVTDGTALTEWRRNWPVVAATTAGVALSTTHIYSLGVMIAPLQAAFGWSRTQISSGLLLGSLIAVFSSPFIGLLIDRVGPRRVALCGASLFCLAVGLLSLAGPSIWSWLALWVFLAIAISGITPTIWTAAVSGLFEQGRGLALSISLCGTGLGASLTPIVTHLLEAAYGWRIAYFGLALFWALLTLPLLFLFFTSSLDRIRRDRGILGRSDVLGTIGFTAREGYRSPRFYKLAVAATAIALVVVSFAVNLVPILTSQGLSPASAAEIASVVGISSIVGRLTGGYLLDRISGNIVAAVCVLFPVISCALLLLMPGQRFPAIAAAAALGLSLGAELDAVAYLATRHLGMRSFGVLFGTISGLLSLATGIGPLLVNHVFDVAHSYLPALWAYIPLCGLASMLFASLGRYPDFEHRVPGYDMI